MPPKHQPYVPGLHARPDDLEVPYPQPVKQTEASILIQDFLSGRKNPTMCLHEYCAQKKLSLSHKQEPVEYKPGLSHHGGFGFRAVVEGLAYQQGVASTKKDAKNEASRLALRALIGLDAYEPKTLEPELDDFRFEEARTVSDLCELNGLAYDKVMTKDSEGQHVCTVTLSLFGTFHYKSFSREEAVVKAHIAALEALTTSFPMNASAATTQPTFNHILKSPCTGPRIPDPNLALLRQEAAYEALDTTLQKLPLELELSSCEHHIAVIFAVHSHWPGFEGTGKIVAFGAGNSSIAVESLSLDGRCLIDSSGLVMARRTFKRYLAQEIIFGLSSSQSSIFERSCNDPKRLQLKKDLTFHLYLSHPLDGDYKEALAVKTDFTDKQLAEIDAGAHYPTFTDDTHGRLRCKNEQGYVEQTSQTPQQTSMSAVKLANEMRVMSESDKLLRWNILGLQGAALTHVIDPVYLSSVSLGYHDNNDHGHLCRAICCRVYTELGAKLPQPYVINHPVLSFVLEDTRRNCQSDISSTQECINWNFHDKKVELTDGLTGRSHERSPFQVSKQYVSRQCKAGQHFKWFKDICSSQEACNRLKLLANKSPLEVKHKAEQYQKAKTEFMNHILECEIGKWIHAPPELSKFTQ